MKSFCGVSGCIAYRYAQPHVWTGVGISGLEARFAFYCDSKECDGGRLRSLIHLAMEKENINMAKVTPSWTCQKGGDNTRFGERAYGLFLA